MKKHSVTIAGHKTSVTLEEPFWKELECLANVRNISVNKLIAEIDSAHQEANLSSALRVYILAQALKKET